MARTCMITARIWGSRAREHLAFGKGEPHLCWGNPLARMEVRIMFEELITRIDRAEQVGELRHVRSNFVNGIKSFPVRATTR
jgi:cytochrome P450